MLVLADVPVHTADSIAEAVFATTCSRIKSPKVFGRPDLIPFICDAAKSKIGQYMPASHIPILPPSVLDENTPDYLVILPWNIAEEVMKQNAHLVEKGTKFVIAVPELKII